MLGLHELSLEGDGHLLANEFSATSSCHRATIESDQLVGLQLLGLHELSLESDGHLLANENASSF